MAKRLGLVLALLLGVTESRADKPNLTFQSGIELINLNVCVMDGRNRYITDLAKADFTILEDGVRQQVSLFTRRRLDVSRAWERFGFRASTPFADGLRRTIEWYRAHEV